VADRLRTVAEKLGLFGPVQRACALTFAAADADAARLIVAFPDGPGAGAGVRAGSDAGSGAGLLAAWDEAAVAWDGLGEPYPLGETLLHAAEAALACGDRDGAAERLGRAAALAAALGAQPLGEQIAILARRARIRLDGSAGDAAVPADDGAGELGLTERELEVLRLVAEGRSNREIAGELFISPKTASVHVSNILGKLGVASRGEAAARAHSLRLFDPAGGA
jgi:DNA-binding CsgD family transcriptional regulator